MKTYAIFAGGGVKGAAFAGCLKAASELDIEFEGYAGASAGSIVALLACVGYTHEQIGDIMLSHDFLSFFDDRGKQLNKLKSAMSGLNSAFKTWAKMPYLYWHQQIALKQIWNEFGIYKSQELEQFLSDKIKEACPELRNKDDISFRDLEEIGKPSLRVMVSDLTKRKPVICPNSDYPELTNSVVKAVRASAGYPIVFKPVSIDNSLFVDGGLSCNLPIFAFQREREIKNLPVIAFNLVQEVEPVESYSVFDFCGDMLNTALESSEALLYGVLEKIYVIPVKVPADISTLDFNISPVNRRRLFDRGHSATHSYYSSNLKKWSQSTSLVQDLQSLYVPEYAINPILEKLAEEIEDETQAENVRANIMLPTARNTRIIVYQFGMDDDPDKDFELGLESGCSGLAWRDAEPYMADLEEAKKDPEGWGMTTEQVNRVKSQQKAVLSVPIFPAKYDTKNLSEAEPIGVLSVDTSTKLDDTEWMTTKRDDVVSIAQKWADVVSFILRHRAF